MKGYRTTAPGLWRYASEYVEAAELVAPKDGSIKLISPAYHLLGHAIELMLKAFLCANGASLGHLRYVVGHDLECALDEAERLELAKCVKPNVCERFDLVVTMLAPYHLNQDFRYFQAGYNPGLPVIGEAIPAVRTMVEATQGICSDSVRKS